MSNLSLWLVLAGILLIAEITTGTFYLLMVSLGAAVGALMVAFAVAAGFVATALAVSMLVAGADALLGPADLVTLTRATLACGVAALVADSYLEQPAATALVALAVVALVLDAGRVGRRRRQVLRGHRRRIVVAAAAYDDRAALPLGTGAHRERVVPVVRLHDVWRLLFAEVDDGHAARVVVRRRVVHPVDRDDHVGELGDRHRPLELVRDRAARRDRSSSPTPSPSPISISISIPISIPLLPRS